MGRVLIIFHSRGARICISQSA